MNHLFNFSSLIQTFTHIRLPFVFGLTALLMLALVHAQDAPQVELLDAGESPRQLPRYTPEVGVTHTYLGTMRLDVSQEWRDVDTEEVMEMEEDPEMPPLHTRFTMETTTDEITDEGHIRYTFTYTDVELLNAEDLPPELRRDYEEMLRQRVGVSGESLVTDRGIILESHWDSPQENGQETDPMSGDMLGQFEQTVQEMFVPFPEEEVGLGARWQVRTTFEQNGLVFDQLTIYELSELADRQGRLELEINQEADPEQLDLEAAEGEMVEGFSSSSEGSGTLAFHLDRILADAKEMQSVGHSEMQLTFFEETVVVITETRLEVSWERLE